MTTSTRTPSADSANAAKPADADVQAVEEAARVAVVHIQAGNGPYLLECRTYRFRPHSMFDPELYRNKQEVEQWKQRCPITMPSSASNLIRPRNP